MYTKSTHFIEFLDWSLFNLSPQRVSKYLLKIIACLILLFALEKGLIYWLQVKYQIPDPSRYFNYFNFDRESNFPSLYSALSLGLCSFLLSIITACKKQYKARYTGYWQALAYIFLFLSIDEICGIHELFIPIVRRFIKAEGIFYFAWVIPAFFCVAILAIVFRKFVFSLPQSTKILFITAGAVYVSGALGLELVGGYIVDNYGFDTAKYFIVSTTEELLEMIGVVIFIYALLSYIQSYLSKCRITLDFQQLKT